MQVNNFMLSS